MGSKRARQGRIKSAPIPSSKWQKNFEVCSSKQLIFPKMCYSRRKKQTNGGGTWHFHPELLKKQNVVYGTYTPQEKEEEFPGAFKIEQLRVEFLWSWFLTLEFPTVSHSFADFAGVKVCFLQNFSVINDHMLQCMIV